MRDCLDSLLTQNVEQNEYEIICVNDGSTDGSLEVLREYESKYVNIRVIDKENGGVSSARNVGLQEAKGKYIWFIDSDDCIQTNCLRQFKEFFQKNQADAIKIHYTSVNENFIVGTLTEKPLVFELQQGSISTSNVWAMLIKRSLILDNNIVFNTTMKYGEDTLFMYFVYIYMRNNNSYEINIPLYYYRQQSSSAMHKRDKDSMTQRAHDFLTMAYTYRESYQNSITNDPVKKDNALKRQHLAIKAFLTVLPKSNLDYKEAMQKLKEDKFYPYPFLWWYLKEKSGFTWKLKEFCFCFFKYKFIYKLYYTFMKKLNK